MLPFLAHSYKSLAPIKYVYQNVHFKALIICFNVRKKRFFGWDNIVADDNQHPTVGYQAVIKKFTSLNLNMGQLR